MRALDMKYTQIILYFFGLIYLVGCVGSIRERVDDPEFLKGIKSITIYNRTQNEHIPHSIEIKDASKISKIMDELRNLEDYSIDNMKANFGFYELEINYSNRKSYEVEIT